MSHSKTKLGKEKHGKISIAWCLDPDFAIQSREISYSENFFILKNIISKRKINFDIISKLKINFATIEASTFLPFFFKINKYYL